jgi:crotonobetainyl-CoA:carnitine CoA-transferase CaiB-like acyl-CoA transferase
MKQAAKEKTTKTRKRSPHSAAAAKGARPKATSAPKARQRASATPKTAKRPPQSVFQGIRILDVGHIVAGPIAASVFADFGAEVIKIERPGHGDPLRNQFVHKGAGLHYKMEARNKKSMTLDLKTPEGKKIFRELVKVSDVVVENFRPGVMEKLGFGWEALKKLNPRIIMLRLSGFGQTGPYSPRRAMGRLGEAFGGFTHITGDADGPPMHSQMSLGDTVAGVWAAMGIMMALYWRDAQGGGKGQMIDIGLYEGIYRMIEQQIIVPDQMGYALRRRGNAHNYTPFVCSFDTKDGGHFSVSAATMKSAMDVLRAMGMDKDKRFNDWDRCRENVVEYRRLCTEWFASRTIDQVDKAFQKYGAPGARVMSGADLMKDPHLLARDMVITVQDDELGPIKMQGIVPKMSDTPGKVEHSGQKMGASNDFVLAGILGMSAKQIGALKAKGII